MAETRDQYRLFHAARHRMIRELLAAYVPERVPRMLDVGGGGDIGHTAGFLRERVAEGIYALDQGADVAAGRDRGLEARACDIDRERFPFDDGFFDVVLFASVLEHLYNPRHVLDEIQRVTKPGGLLFLETPNAVALGRRLDALAGRNPFGRFNACNAAGGKAPMERCAVFYTPDEVTEALGEGYETLAVRYAMHAPPAGAAKRAARSLLFHAAPTLGDCFCVVARRRAA